MGSANVHGQQVLGGELARACAKVACHVRPGEQVDDLLEEVCLGQVMLVTGQVRIDGGLRGT